MESSPDLTRDLAAHGAALRRTARALVHDEHAADDAVQDAWLAALTRGDRSPLVAPLAWLRTVVRRRALDERTRSAVRRSDSAELDRIIVQEGEPPSEAALRVAQAVHALPPADKEIVVRRFWQGQPPRVIARELGLDSRAVRNRLHRALARLRRDLVPPDGNGSRTLSVWFAPLLRTSSSADSVPASLALSVAMTSKAVAVATVVVVTLAAFLLHGPSGLEDPPEPSAPLVRAAPEGAKGSPVELAAVDGGSSLRAVAEAQAAPDVGPLVAEPESEPQLVQNFGHVILTVLDGATGEETLDYVVRGRRLEADEATTTVEGTALALHPWGAGRWEAAVFSAGFDPVLLGAFTIAPDRTTDLGRRTLAPGTGTLEGIVVGSELERCSVELFGVGRRPGSCCRSPGGDRTGDGICSICGYGEAVSVDLIEAGETFRFRDLAGGPYDLVVREPSGRILASRPFVLESRDARWMEVTLEAADLEVWLTGPDEQPFDGLWLEEGQWFSSTLRIVTWSDDVLVTTGDVAPAEEGRKIERNDLDRSLLTADARPESDEDDSSPLAALWPSALDIRPRVSGVPGVVERLGPGRFVVRRVPAEVTSAQVACGPFMTPRTTFEHEPGVGRVARIQVLERCSFSSKNVPAGEGISCTTCHRAPDVR